MGLFDKLFGKKEEKQATSTAASNTKEMTFETALKGSVVTFPPLYDDEVKQFSGMNASIVEKDTILVEKDNANRKMFTWLHLFEDSLILDKEASKMKVMREIKDINDFVEAADMDILNEVLRLDEDEMDGDVVSSNDKQIVMNSAFSMVQATTYFINEDALVNSAFFGGRVRMIEAKTSDRKYSLNIVVKPEGETLIFEGVLMDAEGFEYF